MRWYSWSSYWIIHSGDGSGLALNHLKHPTNSWWNDDLHGLLKDMINSGSPWLTKFGKGFLVWIGHLLYRNRTDRNGWSIHLNDNHLTTIPALNLVHLPTKPSFFMISNFFKIAIRNLRKNKIFSFINILGLSIGLTCFLLWSVSGSIKKYLSCPPLFPR